jgi:hypothetical protein
MMCSFLDFLRLFRVFSVFHPFAAHNALFLAGASPAAGIGCLPA